MLCEAAIADRENTILVSVATIWELHIKQSLGKLDYAPRRWEQEVEIEGFSFLPIIARHAAFAGDLPRIHGDPFDRMLVAQSLTEKAILMTCDRTLAAYGVPVFP